MATESTKVSIKSLNGTNYATWKIQCRMALIKDGLWGIVNDTEDTPNDEREIPKFMLRRDRALATIVLSMEPTLLYLLGPDPEDPTEVWKKLADQFQKKTWSNKLTLRRKLYDLKLKDGQSVQKHVKALTEIFDELAIIGDPLDDESKVVHLLASLPDAYDILVTRWKPALKYRSWKLSPNDCYMKKPSGKTRTAQTQTQKPCQQNIEIRERDPNVITVERLVTSNEIAGN